MTQDELIAHIAAEVDAWEHDQVASFVQRQPEAQDTYSSARGYR